MISTIQPLIINGTRESRLVCQAILANAFSLEECKRMSGSMTIQNECVTQKHTIAKYKYRSLQNLFSVLDQGNAVPTQEYPYPVSEHLLQNLLNYIERNYSPRPGLTRSTTFLCHYFNNLPVYSRGGIPVMKIHKFEIIAQAAIGPLLSLAT